MSSRRFFLSCALSAAGLLTSDLVECSSSFLGTHANSSPDNLCANGTNGFGQGTRGIAATESTERKAIRSDNREDCIRYPRRFRNQQSIHKC